MKIFNSWLRFGSDRIWMNREVLAQLTELPEEAFEIPRAKFLFQLENGDLKSVVCPDLISDPEFFWQTQASAEDLLLHSFNSDSASLGGYFPGVCGHVSLNRNDLLAMDSGRTVDYESRQSSLKVSRNQESQISSNFSKGDFSQSSFSSSGESLSSRFLDFGVCDFEISFQELKKVFESWELQQIEEWVPKEIYSQAALVEADLLFLDRDNVIVHDVPYNKDPQQVRLLEGISELLVNAKQSGFVNVMVSNQSGVGRGMMTANEFWSVQKEVQRQLLEKGAALDLQNWAFYHESTEFDELLMRACLRKPRGGMFWKCRGQFSLGARSAMVGDKASDLIAAYWGGVRRLFLLSDSNKEKILLEEFQQNFEDFEFQIVSNLSEAQLKVLKS